MADQGSSIDLTTLAEVQRLLASTEFASIDDLAHRSGANRGDRSPDGPVSPPPVRSTPTAVVDSIGSDPLPRRR